MEAINRGENPHIREHFRLIDHLGQQLSRDVRNFAPEKPNPKLHIHAIFRRGGMYEVNDLIDMIFTESLVAQNHENKITLIKALTSLLLDNGLFPKTTPNIQTRMYEIKPDDTIESLARGFNMPHDQLLELNPTKTSNPNLQVGEKIYVPISPQEYQEKREAQTKFKQNITPDTVEITLPEDILSPGKRKKFEITGEEFYNLLINALRVRIKHKSPQSKTKRLDFEELALLFLEK